MIWLPLSVFGLALFSVVGCLLWVLARGAIQQHETNEHTFGLLLLLLGVTAGLLIGALTQLGITL